MLQSWGNASAIIDPHALEKEGDVDFQEAARLFRALGRGLVKRCALGRVVHKSRKLAQEESDDTVGDCKFDPNTVNTDRKGKMLSGAVSLATKLKDKSVSNIWGAAHFALSLLSKFISLFPPLDRGLDALDVIATQKLLEMVSLSLPECGPHNSSALLSLLHVMTKLGALTPSGMVQKLGGASALNKMFNEREDAYVAQLDLLRTDADNARERLKSSLENSVRLTRELHNLKDALSKETTRSGNCDRKCEALERDLAEERAKAMSLRLQLEASEAAHKEARMQLAEEVKSRSALVLSMNTLMKKLEVSENTAREAIRETEEQTEKLKLHGFDLEEAKGQLQQTRSECDLLRKASENLRSELRKSHRQNRVLMEELTKMELQLTEVEGYMKSSNGGEMKTLELDLAQARLQLAQAEAEKDDLEHEVSELRTILQNIVQKKHIATSAQ